MTNSRRRCCLCLYLDHRDEVRAGQIAHVNRNSGDSSFENLVFLCLEHHDQYDGRTSQSKGVSELEVRTWRDHLYKRYPDPTTRSTFQAHAQELPQLLESSDYSTLINENPKLEKLTSKPWRFSLWQVANQPELFAYSTNGAYGGICLIERIDIPDGRIVIVCIQVPGNPGKSITNAVENVCFQVCSQFNIPADKLVWIEHYHHFEPDEWQLVTFSKMPPDDEFSGPQWKTMTAEMWKNLRLRPKKQMRIWAGSYVSKVAKLFPWPSE